MAAVLSVGMLAHLRGCAAQRGFINNEQTTKYAAFSVIAQTTGSLQPTIGNVTKEPTNPLLVQDKPWEPRLDNAYPNVVHDPHSAYGAYRLWYGGFICGDDFDKSEGRNRVNVCSSQSKPMMHESIHRRGTTQIVVTG